MSFLHRYRSLLLVIVAILALVIASPLIEQYVSAPKTEPLTEFFVLGPYHNATYPFNLTSGNVYPLYLTVDNQLGSQVKYKIEAKFRDQNQSGPDSFNHTQSSLQSLTDFTVEVEAGQSVELQVNLVFNYEVDSLRGESVLDEIVVNGTSVGMDGMPLPWDSEANAFLGNIFFELYLYNDTTGTYQYNQRYVGLWVNLS
jgi:uncharacterized membrane protein